VPLWHNFSPVKIDSLVCAAYFTISMLSCELFGLLINIISMVKNFINFDEIYHTSQIELIIGFSLSIRVNFGYSLFIVLKMIHTILISQNYNNTRKNSNSAIFCSSRFCLSR